MRALVETPYDSAEEAPSEPNVPSEPSEELPSVEAQQRSLVGVILASLVWTLTLGADVEAFGASDEEEEAEGGDASEVGESPR